ncbi:MAG: hypothetical protein QOF53_1212 [Nocardioidaceae bacterium]|nr:hypothetical protein [Nocardioidaceae bacterium]
MSPVRSVALTHRIQDGARMPLCRGYARPDPARSAR